jgi:hypothetical protein
MDKLKYILFSFVFISFLFFGEHLSESKQGVEWVCWVSSITNKDCNIFGMSKCKNVAIQVAFAKCDQYCGTLCKLDYCEQIKN